MQLEDDLDGGPADETIHFAFEGQEYVIDLNSKNAEALRSVFEQYRGRARRVSVPGGGRGAGRGGTRRITRVPTYVNTTTVRAWAESNRIEVGQRGRLPKSLVAQFREAGN